MNEPDAPLPPPSSGHWDVALPPEVRALADQMTPLFYDDLKRLAHRERHRVGAGNT
jgi:hypothetical protein